MDNPQFHPRSVIFKEGAKGSKLYVVKSGEVLCLKSSRDRLIPVFLAKEGDIVGESAMIQDMNYTYSAIAWTTCELIEVTSFAFKQVLGKAPDWLVDLTSTMITRFQSTSNMIAENRIIHPSIISDELFDSQTEIEFKKLLS